ncbi:unnamed protein product [Auanema sp. JU1783]|nr:unnamed protein product [Auanema sp. JU1783]
MFYETTLVPAVSSKCFYTNQTYDEATWPLIYILNPFDDEGNPVAGNCTIFADSGSDLRTLWHFQIQQFVKTDSLEDAYINVFNSDGSPLFTHVDGTTSTSSDMFTTKSSSRNVIINVVVPSKAVSIVGQMEGTPSHHIETSTVAHGNKVVNPKFR